MIKFLDLKKQYTSIQHEIDEAIKTVISEAAFIGGKHLQKFEEEFGKYQEANYCIGVGNGTDALEIAIESLNLPHASEIIVPANSFIASSEAISRCGHRVVFCDCNPDNYTISLASIKSNLTTKTKAIIAVHLYGHPCDMDEIITLAKEYKLKVIEDCAQAHGARYKGKRVGALGDIGTFSFYPGKNLGAYGDGGAILTNDETVAKRCRMIANHGRVGKYNHEFEGRNSRLDALQAAILSVKLNHLEVWTKARVEIGNFYLESLQEITEISLPKREQWANHVYHLFVIRAQNRDALQAYLQKNMIETGVHYPSSLPKLKAYANHFIQTENYYANSYDEQLLSLPIGEHLSLENVIYVCNTIKKFYEQCD